MTDSHVIGEGNTFGLAAFLMVFVVASSEELVVKYHIPLAVAAFERV